MNVIVSWSEVLLECCCHFELPSAGSRKSREVTASGREVVHQWCVRCHLNCVSRLAPLLYDVSSHCLCFFLNIKCVLPCHIQISHTLNEPLPGSYPLPPLSPRQHTMLTALVSHVSENDIQFAEISLLHRHHQQSGLTAEIDALSPTPTSLRTHPSATAIAYTRGATADTKYMQLAAASYCGVWPRDRGHRCQGVERWRKKEMF